MGTRPGKLKPAAPSQPISAHRRGYNRQYRKFRESYIRLHPACQDCGELPEKSELHHLLKILDRPDLATDPNNVLHLCQRCHQIRTDRGE